MAGSARLACLSFVLLIWRLPRGLMGTPVDLKTWTGLANNRMVVLLLLITTLQMSGQFVVFTFMGPLLTQLTGAGPDGIGLVFRALWHLRLCRDRDRDAHRRWMGSFQNVAAVHAVPACGRRGLGRHSRIVRVDGGVRRDLGPWFRLDQFDAAGAAGRGSARIRRRVGVAEYIGALCGAGDRFGDRRRAVCQRATHRRGLRRRGICRAGVGRGGDHRPDFCSESQPCKRASACPWNCSASRRRE